jgi:hypothetical protein
MSLLRQIFGPSKAEIWRQFASQIGADYIDGGFWKGVKVEAHHGEWTITLDTYTDSSSDGESTSSTTYTRIRAPYVNRDGLQFQIYRKSVFSKLGQWLGMRDIEIGDAEFDEAFVIKGTNEQKLRELFANQKIRDLIACQPSIRFSVKDDEGWFAAKFPDGVDELYFEVAGVIKDIERLKSLYELFGEVLDQLCRIGSAYEKAPGVVL